jgi:hypothetical protein
MRSQTRTRRARIRSLPRRVRVSWRSSPWSRSSVPIAGQPATRGRRRAAGQPVGRRRRCSSRRGGAISGHEAVVWQDGRLRVLRPLRTARGEKRRPCRRRISGQLRPGGDARGGGQASSTDRQPRPGCKRAPASKPDATPWLLESLVPTEERVEVRDRGLLDGSDDLSRIEEMPH